MYNLYYLHFNNYYNRLLKRYETLNEYISNSVVCGISSNVNFFPNDGVSTAHTPYIKDFNVNSNNSVIIPDYLIVCDTNNNILSRWYVIECVYNTGKTQYKMSLYRDVIAEYWNDVVNKPFYCEKGYLPTYDNGIFNDEAITTSQVKESESLIQDKTGIPWIVGYRAIPKSNETINDELDITNLTPDYIVDELSNWEYYNSNIDIIGNWKIAYQYYHGVYDNSYSMPFDNKYTFEYKVTNNVYNWGSQILSPMVFRNHLQKALDTNNFTNLSDLVKSYANASDVDDFINFSKFENRIIYDTSQDKYYRIVLKKEERDVNGFINIGSDLANEMVDIIQYISENYSDAVFEGNISNENLLLHWNGKKYSFEFKEITISRALYYSTDNINRLLDAPYCAFCIPYGDMCFIDSDSDYEINTNALLSLNIATELAAKLSSKIYDIQLLPYCPIKEIRESGNIFNFNNSTMVYGKDFEYIINLSNSKPLNVLFWMNESSFDFSIVNPVTNYKSELIAVKSAIDFKVDNQTKFLRICSPNYNGVFEINPFKNRGIDYFKINCTYKPFQPFIQISPNFKGLYGDLFNDSRGLILGGDFSLPLILDKWQEYEIQNKNYQTMFNRQIENMEVQHKYQRREQIANAITGTLSAAATGAISGSMVGGGIGGAIGGGISGIASAVGGVMDLTAGDALRTEALDYTRDMYGYNLDNIKALPNALTRVSAFSIINKLFPFIEVYNCTDEEREAVTNKIIYNGMTVERIGTIGQFVGNTPRQYIKGKLIRFENLEDDFHVLKTLSDELNKGVFVNNGNTI